jgi:hypothetical protein
MTLTLPLPKDLEDWARAEVAAGRAHSLEDLARDALELHRRQAEAFTASLDDAVAEADRDGWVEGEDVLAWMDSMIADLEREPSDANHE